MASFKLNRTRHLTDCVFIQGHANSIPTRPSFFAAQTTNEYCCYSHLKIVCLLFSENVTVIYCCSILYMLRLDAILSSKDIKR